MRHYFRATASCRKGDERLEGALPNPPKITFGKVIAQKTNGGRAAV
jgi:hypothetical protein